jgi:hypothetical protein
LAADVKEGSGSFLKKRTKKLSFGASRVAPTMSGRWQGQGIKVFWFFFSKKNRFLPPAPP